MKHFQIQVQSLGEYSRENADLYMVGFTDAIAENNVIVREIAQSLADQPRNGELALISGRISVPGAFVMAHALGHVYGAVAVYDPKLNKYVICITHSPRYPIGELICI